MCWHEGEELKKSWIWGVETDGTLMDTGAFGDGMRRAYRCPDCRFIAFQTDQ